MASAAQPPFIPSTFEELSPEFLTDALQAGRVSERSVSVIGEGLGFAGQVARIRMSYADPEQACPESIIAKLPSTNSKTRSTVEFVNGYEREVCFYQELAARSRLSLPRCYYAAMDADPYYERRPTGQRLLEALPVWLYRAAMTLGSGFPRSSGRRYLVLIEDLAPAECGDQLTGCDLEAAVRAVRGLAEFHASYWADPTLEEKIWLPSVHTMPRIFMAAHRSARRRFLRENAGAVTPEMLEAFRWVDDNFEAMCR